MSPSDPMLREDDQPDEAPAPEAHSAAERRVSDPWGVKRAENLLTSLQGVLSARVEASPLGEVTAVHILATASVSPKQMVRNVESALLAHLGLKVDHRKISIAQTAEVKPIAALEREAVHDQARKRLVLFKGIEVVPVGSLRVKMTVTLVVVGKEASAEEEVADTERSRMQGAARAALAILDRMLPGGTIELEGLRAIDAFDSELIMVAVRSVDGRESQLLSGSAVVKEAPERAAVLAVLDATNRWVQART